MSEADVQAEKAEMRKAAARKRLQIKADNPDAPTQLAQKAGLLIESFSPQIIAGFWPIKSELDISGLMMALCGYAPITLCLPITGRPETPLSFHQWQPGDKLDIGPYDTRQPFAHQPVLLPDLILLPLLAFDGRMNRLGYGGGFYDRTLASLAQEGHNSVAIGIAYNQQQVEKVPTSSFDRPLDGVLTPSGLVLAKERLNER